MQTFLTSYNMKECAANLDRLRLGKQRVEAIQIANTLLGFSNGWKNHPAVKMWYGHELFLIYIYIPAMLNEWEKRGYKNIKVLEHLKRLKKFIKWEYNYLIKTLGYNYQPIFGNLKLPKWINDELIESHKSNLIRKKPEYYLKKFPNTIQNLPYIWPK